MQSCLYCSKKLPAYASKYCSNQCQSNHRYKEYINRWKLGQETGSRGVNTKNLSGHILRYIFSKYDSKCTECGWNTVNIHTGNIPLEVDHIDGDSENNTEDNLILLCPNCHSLTNTYKNQNKGHGRLWRRERYDKMVKMPL